MRQGTRWGFSCVAIGLVQVVPRVPLLAVASDVPDTEL
jgi:hypothetical protein